MSVTPFELAMDEYMTHKIILRQSAKTILHGHLTVSKTAC
jgi:hypothetical protein